MTIESVENIAPEISCSTCIAACCRAGAALQLTHDEVYRNKQKMELHQVYKERKYPQEVPVPVEKFDSSGRHRAIVKMHIPARYGLYVLTNDCGNLTEDNQCGVYEERPRACRDYEVGSTACL